MCAASCSAISPPYAFTPPKGTCATPVECQLPRTLAPEPTRCASGTSPCTSTTTSRRRSPTVEGRCEQAPVGSPAPRRPVSTPRLVRNQSVGDPGRRQLGRPPLERVRLHPAGPLLRGRCPRPGRVRGLRADPALAPAAVVENVRQASPVSWLHSAACAPRRARRSSAAGGRPRAPSLRRGEF